MTTVESQSQSHVSCAEAANCFKFCCRESRLAMNTVASTGGDVAEWRSSPLAFDRMELSVLRRGDDER